MNHRNTVLSLILLVAAFPAACQEFHSDNAYLDSAFSLAVNTLDRNTHDGIIFAGGGYGGEWTRDCAINSRNAANMLRPEAARNSLWSVTYTEGGKRFVGHQYWDKILWVLAAWNHYLWTGDKEFLGEAYLCGVNTMRHLEDSCLDSRYGLFRGPAVFQDGIEAYDVPVFDPEKWDDSFVLHHPHGGESLCLSTNLVYAEAYKVLSLMADEQDSYGFVTSMRWMKRHDELQSAIKRHLLSPDGRMNYLIDYTGSVHHYQEGLGIAFALLYDLTDGGETTRMMSHVVRSRYGITSVYPCFPRNSAEKPGRHNDMVWPHVNALFASGCLHKGLDSLFYSELESQYNLAIRCGEGCFYEIYTVDGIPSGGYQCGAMWGKQPDQTWCATGFIRNVVEDLCGVRVTPDGLVFQPVGMRGGSECVLKGIRYRNALIELHIRGRGHDVRSCRINGRRSRAGLPVNAKGRYIVEIVLE